MNEHLTILQNAKRKRKRKKGVDIKWAADIEQKVASNLRILCMVNENECDQKGR